MKKHPWMLWYAVFLHLVWGTVLFFDARAGWTTALHEIVSFCGSEIYAGFWLIGAALLATGPLIKKKMGFVFRVWCLLPQQLLVMISAWGALVATMNSKFADGVVRPSMFIFADQFPAILVMVFHTLAFVNFHAGLMDEGP